MSKRLSGEEPPHFRTTDHSEEIGHLRQIGQEMSRSTDPDTIREGVVVLAVAELLVCHDHTGISLDQWPEVRTLVETVLAEAGLPGTFLESGA
jgi:hypothetical protein